MRYGRTSLTLADAYKEQIHAKLFELVPERITRIDSGVFDGKTTEEVLALMYMQGVTEALDAFDVSGLLRVVQNVPVSEPKA